MKNQKINQEVSPGTNNQKQKNYYIIDNLLGRLMKCGQGTQNFLTLLTLQALGSLPNDSLGGDIVLISTITLKKRGKVKAITKTPCVAKRLPICLVDVNPFFSKQRISE